MSKLELGKELLRFAADAGVEDQTYVLKMIKRSIEDYFFDYTNTLRTVIIQKDYTFVWGDNLKNITISN